jgi:flagellar hook-length control protein FliK
MTPSASASPIVLLAPAAAPTAATTGAENAATPALDGGFQLLVDVAAQQQLAAQLGGGTQKSAVVPTGQGGDVPAAAGNGLPLPGLILPEGDGKSALADLSGNQTEDIDGADAAAPSTATIPVPWVPINIQPQQPVARNAGSRVTADTDGAIDASLDLDTAPMANATGLSATDSSAQPAIVNNHGAVAAPAADADGIQLGAPGMPMPAAGTRQFAADASPRPSFDASVTPSADGAAALGGDGAGTRKGGDLAGFADALKPALAATGATDGAQSTTPTTGVMDTGRAHAPTRSYLDVNSAAATATVAVPVGNSGWSDAVVDKVMWFSANQINSAEIKLNPPDLGPLHVRISTQQDQTSVVFSSPHAAVRDALDQALPRLRDMFGGQGLQLSDASVGGQAQRQQQQQGDNNPSAQSRNAGWFGGEEGGEPVAVSRVVAPRISSSAVDAYA